mgnify:CR=1 FL=1
MPKEYCGYISIIGKPNVGKSTILNAILEKKVSITSRKSQTTRNNILGVKTHKNKQMIFDSILPNDLEIILKTLRNIGK